MSFQLFHFKFEHSMFDIPSCSSCQSMFLFSTAHRSLPTAY